MEPKAFKVLLRRAVLLPLLTTAMLAAVLLLEAYDMHRSMQWVDHSDRVTSSCRRLLKLILDMETGLRGYLVTGNFAFLLPYQEARQNFEPQYQSLQRMVANDPGQQRRLAQIHESYTQWQEHAELMIDLRQKGSEYTDIAVNLEGKRLMDVIRSQGTEFQEAEDQLRDTRTRRAQFRWRMIIVSCFVVGIGAGLIIGYLTTVEMRALAAGFQRSLDNANSRAAELARSEERWATTLASIGDAVIATDAQGKITFVNPVAEPLLQLSAGECVGRQMDEVFRLVQEETGAAVESPVAKAIRLNRVIELGNSVALLGHKGVRTPIADSAAPIRDASGRMAGVVLVFRDVTERRNQERERSEALAREQAQRQIAEETAGRLRKIEQVTEMTLAHLPLEMMMDLLLRRVAAALQADAAQILLLDENSQTLELKTSLGLRGAVTKFAMGQGIAGRIAQTGQLKIVDDLAHSDVIDPEVREHTASLMGVPLVVEDKVIGVMHVDSKTPRKFTQEEASLLQVVADRIALAIEGRQAEEAMRKSKELLENLVREAPVALAMFDRNMRYLQFSQRWIHDTGLRDGNLLGRSQYEVFPKLPEHWKDMHRRGLAGESLKAEEDWIAADGRTRTIQWEIHPWGDEGTESGGIIFSFVDLTERKQIEKAIRESDRLATTGRLAATIAHEIHNPLDAVGNLLYLIKQATEETETRNFAALASEELQRVTQMTQQMLTFQRESAQPIAVKIRDVLDNVLALYERRIHAAGARVSAEIDFDGQIRALPGEIRQVFANLVGNGLEALQDGHGRLRVRAYAGKDWRCGSRGLKVVVADNGRGIPDEIRGKIFEPFFTTKGESGTGLGLWIASGIVEKYGGNMRVRSSTRQGRSGTCFSIFFPSETAG